MPIDFLGQELNVGDDVVYLNHSRTSSSLGRGKITSMSEHTVTIDLATRRAEYKVVKIPRVEHGYWEFDFNLSGDNFYRCSVCGEQEILSENYDIYDRFPYCHCGAKMDREGEDDV